MIYQVRYPVELDAAAYKAVKGLVGKLGELDGQVVARIVTCWLSENGYLRHEQVSKIQEGAV